MGREARGNIKNELIKLGLKETEQNTAMVANLHTILPTINMPEGFTIQKASSSGQIKKFGEALASLFGISEEGNMYKNSTIKLLLPIYGIVKI